MSASKKGKKGNGHALKKYRSYPFTDHDPMMDRVVLAVENSDRPRKEIFDGNCAPGTFTNWKRLRTKRPQHATMAATLGALGLEFEIRLKRR